MSDKDTSLTDTQILVTQNTTALIKLIREIRILSFLLLSIEILEIIKFGIYTLFTP